MFKNHLDLFIIIYDTYKRFEHIINNCTEYGFKDCKNSYSEGLNVNDFLWNKWHITELGNKIITEDINNFLNSISN